MPRYKEIADDLKYSIRTGGLMDKKLPGERVLSKKYSVSRDTLRKALDILQLEGYVYKKTGSGVYISDEWFLLRNRIAVIVNDAEEHKNPVFIFDLRNALSKEGYSLDIYETDKSHEKERAVLKELLNSPVRGIVVIPESNSIPTPNFDLYSMLIDKHIPVVFWGGAYPNIKTGVSVDDDYVTLSLKAVNEIMSGDLITSKICPVLFADDKRSIDIYDGLCRALSPLNIVPQNDEVLWLTGNDLEILRKKRTHERISSFIKDNVPISLSEPITYFICSNDETAYYIAMDQKENERVKVISFEESYLGALSGNRIIYYTPEGKKIIDDIISSLLYERKQIYSKNLPFKV
ncbi:MAG: GntR family transcriptional regulator [Lachnospiraceae bacterium]|nr:GntR family transcriptional regulator [Lachnospiraceae bacterium]